MAINIDEEPIETFADVHAAFARQRLVRKQDVARKLGTTPDKFSAVIRDLDGRPSAEWIARFRHAWKEVEQEKSGG